jgi:hypothetical protein
MLSTLALIPKVQVLGLCGALPTESYATPPPLAIDLPFLEELHLSGTGQGISAVLQALIFRDSVQVYVTLPQYSHGERICSNMDAERCARERLHELLRSYPSIYASS